MFVSKRSAVEKLELCEPVSGEAGEGRKVLLYSQLRCWLGIIAKYLELVSANGHLLRCGQVTYSDVVDLHSGGEPSEVTVVFHGLGESDRK